VNTPEHPATPDRLDQAAAALSEALRNVEVPAGPSGNLMAATIRAVECRAQAMASATSSVAKRPKKLVHRRCFLMIPAAAVLIVLVCVMWFGDGSATVLAKALDNVERAKSVTFVETQKVGDHREVTLKHYLQGHHGRVEIANGANVLIVDTKERKALLLVAPLKAAEKYTEDKVNSMRGDTPIGALLRLKDQKPEAAERAMIDGKPTLVARVRGGKWGGSVGDWTIWIDPRTELPVKIAFESTESVPKVTKTLEKFSWNAELEDKLFEQDVPAGYTLGLPWEKDVKKDKP
jgi:outer membrane lipoprotein-sorting protein